MKICMPHLKWGLQTQKDGGGMRNLKQKRCLICLLLCTATLLSGCQTDKKEKGDGIEKATYRDAFTEDEKTNGTAKFELMENVTVDAQITPAEKYRDGLKKYYMKHFFETEDLKNIHDFIKNPTLFGRKLTDTMDILSEKVGGKFSGKLTFDKYHNNDEEIGVRDAFQHKNGTPYRFYTYWYIEEKDPGSNKEINCPCMYLTLEEGKNKALDAQIDYKITQYLKDYKNMEISFIKDKKKTGEELKEYLEKLIGRKLSDVWYCIPVTAESVAALNKVDKFDISEIKPEEEYCAYRYYYDVKGFPFTDSYLNYQLKEGETASELARMSTPNNTLVGLCDSSILCRISKDGIIDLDTDNIRMDGDVYKKTKKVKVPDDILGRVRKYYEKQILTKPVTITEVRIVYTGYFTDGSEGEIQPTVAPFWRVRVYDGEADGGKYFFYDAFTGEAIAEGMTAMG